MNYTYEEIAERTSTNFWNHHLKVPLSEKQKIKFVQDTYDRARKVREEDFYNKRTEENLYDTEIVEGVRKLNDMIDASDNNELVQFFKRKDDQASLEAKAVDIPKHLTQARQSRIAKQDALKYKMGLGADNTMNILLAQLEYKSAVRARNEQLRNIKSRGTTPFRPQMNPIQN